MNAITADEVHAIAADVFAAMVDGEEGTLAPWHPSHPMDAHDVVAWVDVRGPWAGRASVETSSATAAALTRTLLRLPESEPLTDDDLVDALGELANVVGGNVKALLPEQGTLGLPRVAGALPDDDAANPVQRLPLAWWGRSLVLTVWATDEAQAPAATAAARMKEDR